MSSKLAILADKQKFKDLLWSLWNAKSKNHINKINWNATVKNNETLSINSRHNCQFSKVLYSFCNFSSKPQSLSYGTSFSLSVSAKDAALVAWSHPFCGADAMASSYSLFFNVSIVCSKSSFYLFISFTSSSFNFLFCSISDFCASPFLLSWASFCLWQAFLQLCLVSLVMGKLPAPASAMFMAS